MIVTEFEIDHFRRRNSLRLLDLGNGLNVTLVGDNEDKTAMLSVVPYVLYGRVALDARAWVQPIDSDASLSVQTENGVFRIDRRVDDPDDLLIRSPDGLAADAGYIETLVDGVDPETFFETFTVNARYLRRQLDRRRRRVVEQTQQIAEYLRDASPQPDTVMPRVSLTPLHEMDSCVAELEQVIGSQAELQRDQSKLLAKLPNPEQLKAELKRIEEELTDAQAREQRAIRDVEDTRLAITFHQLRVRLTAIETDLGKLREAPTKLRSKEQSDARTSAIDARLRRCRVRLEQLQQLEQEAHETLADEERAERLRRLIPRIEAVLLQDDFIATEEQSIEQLADTISDLESRIESDRIRAESHAVELAADSERATQSLGDIDRLSAQVKDARRRYRMFRQRKTGLARQNTTQAQPAPMSPSTASAESKAIRHAERTVKQLRERIGVEQRLTDLIAERDQLDEQLRRLYGQHLPPLPMLLMLAIPFALGAAMILNGYLRYDPANIQLIGLGGLVLVVTSLIKLSTDNVNGDQLFQIRNQLTGLNREIDQAKGFREAFDADWSDTIRPWPDQLEHAERQLELLRDEHSGSVSRQPLGQRIVSETKSTATKRVRPDSRIRRSRMLEARQRYRDALSRWKDLMADLELSSNLSPSQARLAVEQKILDAQSGSHLPSSALEFQLRQLRNDLERRRNGLAEMVRHSRQLVQELGYASKGTIVGEQMDILRETLQEYREAEQERAELDRHLDDLKSRAERLHRYARQLNQERKELQYQLDERVEAERTKQQLQAERVKFLQRERDQLLEEIESMSLDEEVDDATVAALSKLSSDQLEARLHDLQHQQQDSHAIVVDLVDRRARVHERLNQMDDLQQIVSRESGWDDVLATTHELSQRWTSASREQQQQTKTLAAHLRQTENYKYVDLAAEHGSGLAGYRLDFSFDHDGTLHVLGRSGKWCAVRRMNPHRLSQIYVSLWLARIQAFADQGVKMPVILDDALSLAPRSRKRLAMLLRDFAARGHQLLLITSRTRHADVFAGLEVPIADLADRETVVAREEEFAPSLAGG